MIEFKMGGSAKTRRKNKYIVAARAAAACSIPYSLMNSVLETNSRVSSLMSWILRRDDVASEVQLA